MGRKERPLDPADGPVEAFAGELRKLREAAGSPPYSRMASSAHVAKTVLSEAAGGRRPPTWMAVRAYLSALGLVDDSLLEEWQQRWSNMRREHAAAHGQNWIEAEPPTMAAEPVTLTLKNSRRIRQRLMIAGGVALLASSAAAIAVISSNASQGLVRSAMPAPTNTLIGLVVSNKVAVGQDALIEDSTPVYLSRTPVPYCAARKCKVPGTEMWSGAFMNVTCVISGAWMTNYNLDAPESKINPHRYASSLWYKGSISGSDKTGFLSEVYIAAEYRGGLGLPVCAAEPTDLAVPLAPQDP